ncbi:MAG: chromosome segregation SMC family protein [Solirubrobacteraceae bacterium]
MHLRSLTVKGFKSFPERTKLEFGPGVSVIVGPNGSGKSNVTDAVLWAMGEQSPLSVRGQSMQDVIFGGGRGVAARSSAEVEIVLDNSDDTVPMPFSEISIVRRLDRTGEGEYRLNGARCRLADVLEVLSDTGLGKESHTVVSQGRVESIVMSKPRERRLLIEEAAGLGKHRRRRRRAQLKLARTEENLDRALDVEREARTRLKPLKRQAEAAELHERLERQALEARLSLANEAARSSALALADAEGQVRTAREAFAAVEQRLAAVSARRASAEEALAQRASRSDAIARGVYGAETAGERMRLRVDQAATVSETLARRIESGRHELAGLRAASEADGQDRDGGRVQQIEAALAELEREREEALARELIELEREHSEAGAAIERAEAAVEAAALARKDADALVGGARERLRAAEQAAREARRAAASVGAELASANQFLRSHARPLRNGGEGVRALSELLRVRDGCELALAAALGGRLQAALAVDRASAAALLDRAGGDGGSVLIAGQAALREADGTRGEDAAPAAVGAPPVPGAEPLAGLIRGPARVVALAESLLGDAWLVDSLDDLPGDFDGIAVTRSGRALFAQSREMRQLAAGGEELVLAKANERDRLIAETERAAQAERLAAAAVEAATHGLSEREREREASDSRLRDGERGLTEARERERRVAWVIGKRREAPAEGPLAVRRAELEGELAAERRQAERIARERAARARRLSELGARVEADTALAPLAKRCEEALRKLIAAVEVPLAQMRERLAADRSAGAQMTAELRACAAEEAEIQLGLRAAGEAVTAAEVAAQRDRDHAEEAELELSEVATKLELDLASLDRDVELAEEEADALRARLERLLRRREQLGPVNPLAQEEYAEAVTHVQELEERRTDLETALRELRSVIRETDRQIKETFEQTFAAAAKNFEELVGEVFPGGEGRLRLVADESGPKRTLGGETSSQADVDGGEAAMAQDAEGASDGELEDGGEADLEGVEIEITPAGKSTKRLSLLSGGEKSMTALAFLFAVFLARQCPFYILDEVEAALDDLNLDRFLALLRRYADRSQFIVITHQRRTMDAADWLYGVSMGGDGVSKVVSRRLPREVADRDGAPQLEVA